MRVAREPLGTVVAFQRSLRAPVSRTRSLCPPDARGSRRDQVRRVGHIDKNQRDRWSSGVDRGRQLRAPGNDNLWGKRYELSHERGDPLVLGLRVTVFDLEILPYDIAMLT